jgi:prepilin-type N-terminal cleavage/methylation domain-containing protein
VSGGGRRRARAHDFARGGFSLLEIVVVLLVLAVATAVAVPAFRSLDDDDRPALDVAQRRVEALFRLARDSAVRSGVPVTVILDSATARVWIDARPRPGAPGAGSVAWTPDEGHDLELPPGVRLTLSTARARFTFTPRGTTFADTLVLHAGTASRALTLNPWTGDAINH